MSGSSRHTTHSRPYQTQSQASNLIGTRYSRKYTQSAKLLIAASPVMVSSARLQIAASPMMGCSARLHIAASPVMVSSARMLLATSPMRYVSARMLLATSPMYRVFGYSGNIAGSMYVIGLWGPHMGSTGYWIPAVCVTGPAEWDRVWRCRVMRAGLGMRTWRTTELDRHGTGVRDEVAAMYVRAGPLHIASTNHPCMCLNDYRQESVATHMLVRRHIARKPYI